MPPPYAHTHMDGCPFFPLQQALQARVWPVKWLTLLIVATRRRVGLCLLARSLDLLRTSWATTTPKRPSVSLQKPKKNGNEDGKACSSTNGNRVWTMKWLGISEHCQYWGFPIPDRLSWRSCTVLRQSRSLTEDGSSPAGRQVYCCLPPLPSAEVNNVYVIVYTTFVCSVRSKLRLRKGYFLLFCLNCIKCTTKRMPPTATP